MFADLHLHSIFSDGTFTPEEIAKIEQRMEAEGKKIEAQARKLCNLLPAMLNTQQELAASLPEFKPYATMTREDIDDCLDDTQDTASADAAEKPSASN